MSTKSAPLAAIISSFVLTCGTGVLLAQIAIQLPKNKYTPKHDVELGREAAAEVRKQYPIIKDEKIAAYLTALGDRLVAAAPAKNPVYQYSFTPVNLTEINAFALPGGPMFVHRGMIEAAATEAEVAGVMAHELAHVLLRHGTANATKAQNRWLQLGQIAGVVGGAVVLAGDQQQTRISQRTAIATPLTDPSALGGLERVHLYTTFLTDATSSNRSSSSKSARRRAGGPYNPAVLIATSRAALAALTLLLFTAASVAAQSVFSTRIDEPAAV